MAVSTSQLSFGAALERAGLGSSLPSRFNPQRLTNNCVFVTLAVLLDTDAATLARRLGLEDRPDETIKIDHVINLILTRLNKRVIWQYENGEGEYLLGQHRDEPDGTIWKLFTKARDINGIEAMDKLGRFWGGACYKTVKGKGHCCVVGGIPGDATYTCYQDSTGGANVSGEASDIKVLFFITGLPPPVYPTLYLRN
jgi:hypothetical protein